MPSTRYQAVPVEETSTNTNLDLEHLHKRKNRARYVSLSIFLITTCLVLVLAFVSTTEDEFYPVKDVEATRTNGTSPVFYEKREKKTFGLLVTTALTFFSAIIGVVFQRLSLVFEEMWHVHTRYGGGRWKMFRACFRGLALGPVVLGIILTTIIIVICRICTEFEFHMIHLVVLFSGIGYGPLVLGLLNLDTESEVHISTIMEKKETYVANTLAWSYYFNDLKKVLPNLQNAIRESSWQNYLSSMKLAILIPLDCVNILQDLPCIDERFCKEATIGCQQETAYSVDVFSVLDEKKEKKYFLVKYAKPLETIYDMSECDSVVSLPKDKGGDEVILFYRALKKIISDPPDLTCRNKCLLLHCNSAEVIENRNSLVTEILTTVCSPAESTLVTSRVNNGVENEATESDGGRVGQQETASANEDVGARDQTRDRNRGEEINVNSDTTGESQVQNQPNGGSSHGIESQARMVDNIRGQRPSANLTGNQPHSNQPTKSISTTAQPRNESTDGLNRTNQTASNETQANGRNPTSTRQITNVDETMQSRPPNHHLSHVVNMEAQTHQNREPQQIATGDSKDTASSNEERRSDIVDSRKSGLITRAECSGDEVKNGEQSYELQKMQHEEEDGKAAIDTNGASGEGQHEVTYAQGNWCDATIDELMNLLRKITPVVTVVCHSEYIGQNQTLVIITL